VAIHDNNVQHHSKHIPSINILAMTTITMFVDGQIAGSHFHALTVELVTTLLAAQPNKGQTK